MQHFSFNWAKYELTVYKGPYKTKEAITLNKKLLSIIGSSVLSAMLLAGCNVNDNPPPEDDTNVEDQGGNGNLDTDLDNGTDDGLLENDANDTNDTNLPGDGDPALDQNTNQEEQMEDEIDRDDADNKDE
jgi:hypothetical protein